MKTTDPVAALLTMAPAQAAYAAALAVFESARLTAEAEKIARGVNYDKATTETEIEAMCELEGEIDAKAGVSKARADLRRAETDLIRWGMSRAVSLSPKHRADFQTLQVAAQTSAVARMKIAEVCFRLAP